MNPKRIALWFLIASVVLSGIMGIFAILSGNFGDLEARIILTTLTISATSICAMACGALWERTRVKVFPISGIVLAVSTASLLIIGIWSRVKGEEFWKFSASVGLVAVATAHACLLSLAKLAPRFAWTRIAAFAAAYFLASLFIFVIYFTPSGDAGIRIIGVTSIVLAGLTILTPVFHRLSRGDLSASGTANLATRQLHETITCPVCGVVLRNSLTETKCESCGCTFVVTILNSSGRATVTE